jgi:radical SAM protein with 4Fe4S-binding SPASM domain
MAMENIVRPDWIVPAIPELNLVEREGRWLCLNPAVPAWLFTTRSGALLLQLVDGSNSIQDYYELLASNGMVVPLPKLIRFFQSALDAKFFEKSESEFDPTATELWENRKLTALYLHVTNRCNLHCSYCYRESSPHIPVINEAGRFCEMLEYIKPFAAPRMKVTFSGGEPLMHPGFREIVETSCNLGYSNSLLTNGTLLTEQLADFVRDHFKLVKISLDGPNEEIHARTRGQGNFAQVVRAIERMAERGARVVVQITVSKSSLPYVSEVKKFLPDRENIDVVFTPLLPMGRGTAANEEDFIANEDFYRISQDNPSGRRYVPGRRSRGCHAGSGSLSIADNGDVYPCHLFHASSFHFGNIFRDSFESIFYGEKAKNYVRSMDVEHNNTICKNCEVRFLCGGGCHANTLHATGDHRGVDSFCSFLKKTIYDNLFQMTETKESVGDLPA